MVGVSEVRNESSLTESAAVMSLLKKWEVGPEVNLCQTEFVFDITNTN